MYPDVVRAARRLAEQTPAQVLFTHLRDGEDDAVSLTAAQLDAAATRVAWALVRRGLTGQRVLVALPTGLDAVIALLGCFHAGAIAVPIPAISRPTDGVRIGAIARDCTPRALLHAGACQVPATLETLQALTVADLLEEAADRRLERPGPAPSDIAVLQYTSGSTGTPRGACITHGNLAHNSWAIAQVRGDFPFESVIWLPPHHDMGLIGGVIHPLFNGNRAVLMSPLHFLQRPVRWLRAISRHRATASAAPDFALRFCTERIRPEELQGLDLNSWSLLYCGAEPVRPSTLERFHAALAPHGLRREVFLPCYGLAEATLIATGKPWNEPLLMDEQGGELRVSCGRPVVDTQLRLLEPGGLAPVAEGQPGEICLSGPGVADGYWSERDAFRSADGQDVLLRTGDIGVMQDGQLFVIGRLKNLIIVRGQNLHAEDIEQAAAGSHPQLAFALSAAFALEDDGAEGLGLVVEVDDKRHAAPPGELLGALRRTLVSQFGVTPTRLVLVRRGTLPRTTSGKVRRQACRTALQEGRLPVMAASDGIGSEASPR